MAERWPDIPVVQSGDGDDPTYSPQKTQNSLLGAERDSQNTRRLETDADRNLYVRMAADDTSLAVTSLAVDAQTNVPDNTLTTVVTYTAAAPKRVSQITFGGSAYAKFQLFLNTVLIDTYRTGPERIGRFVFEAPYALSIGDVVDLKVTHYVTGAAEDFEAAIYGGQ